MKIARHISEPLRQGMSTGELWANIDDGLIACWERGREKSIEDPELAINARDGQLVPLPWKGGIEKAIKSPTKIGTLRYLAMWQGLRGDSLDIETADEPKLRCSKFNVTVTFTNDPAKYADA